MSIWRPSRDGREGTGFADLPLKSERWLGLRSQMMEEFTCMHAPHSQEGVRMGCDS